MSSDGDQPPHSASKRFTVLFRGVPRSCLLDAATRKALRAFAAELERQVAGRGFICVMTNDRELQRLNHSFLGHDYPTDVLSFPGGSEPGSLGEMAISIERAAAQAEEFGHSLLNELQILMLHGVLHLTGLDHERDGGQMARAERKWRTHFHLPEGLIARAGKRAEAKA